MRFWKDERGSVTLIAAFGMVAIMGFLALAIDVGQLRYQKRNLQIAADAAAVAATLEVSYCGGTNACSIMQTAAKSSVTENGLTVTSVVTNCSSIPSTGLTLQLNNGPCALGAADPNYGKSSSVEVVLSQPQSNIFAALFGQPTTTLAVRSEASVTNGGNCIYVLDPSGAGALTVDVLSAVVSQCGIMVESTNRSAISCVLGAITATKITTMGGVQNLICPISPTASTYKNLPTPTDPLAYLPQPATPTCGTTTVTPFHGAPNRVNITGTAVLYSDYAYCGGIQLSAGANVTFMPSTAPFTLTSKTSAGANINSPYGLTVYPGATATGNGVMFYNPGPAGSIQFLSSGVLSGGVNLVAQNAGVYGGILFYQPTTNSNAAQIFGLSSLNSTLQGTYYFPSAKLSFLADGIGQYNILVAYDLEFFILSLSFGNITTSIGANYSSLANGNPLSGNGAVVVQ